MIVSWYTRRGSRSRRDWAEESFGTSPCAPDPPSLRRLGCSVPSLFSLSIDWLDMSIAEGSSPVAKLPSATAFSGLSNTFQSLMVLSG